MEFRTRRENYVSGKVFTLYPIGDMHIGTKAVSKKRLFALRAKILSDPDARWIGMGDYLEWINYKDKRFDGRVVDTTIFNIENLTNMGTIGVKWMANFFEPIMDKCWGMCRGNHEETYETNSNIEVVPTMLEKLGYPEELYTRWTASLRVVFEDEYRHNTYLPIWYEHGWQAGRTQGATRNEMHKLPGQHPGHRIYLRGHSHHLFCDPINLVAPSESGTEYDDSRVYVAHTGAYLETYHEGIVSYAERAGYPPTALGGLEFRISPRRGDCHIEVVI